MHPPTDAQHPPGCQGQHDAINQHAGHQHHHLHSHTHVHAPDPFMAPLIWIGLFTLVEFAGGIYTQSLALLSDAWHMLSDVLAIALAMWAAKQTRRGQAGKRIELWVSLFNAVLMLVVTLWIIYEALERFSAPRQVAGGLVAIVAFLGLIVNLIVAKKMHHHHQHSAEANLNHRAAFLHVIGDLLGSLVAVIAGSVIYVSGWMAIDPILSIVISLLLLVVTANLIQDIRLGFKAAPHAHD